MVVKVVIADEMDLALAGMKASLCHPPCELVGAYSSLTTLLVGLAQTRPDVILLSDRLEPDLDPLSLVNQVRAAAPQAHIILTSPLAKGQIVHEVLQAGVSAFLYKCDPLRDELIRAIEVVMRRRPYLSPTANSEYLLAIHSGETQWALDTEAREILYQMAEGLRPQEIALARGTSVRRVYWIVEKLRSRFGAETNEQLMVRAADEGFLP